MSKVSMRVRIARAMHSARPGADAERPFDSMPEDYRQMSLRMVDAGLAEMTNPTPEMVLAGRSAIPYPDEAEGIYRAMLSAAQVKP